MYMFITSVFVYVYMEFIFEFIYLGIVFINEHVFFYHTIMSIEKKKSPKEKNGLNRDVVATISHNKYRYIIE